MNTLLRILALLFLNLGSRLVPAKHVHFPPIRYPMKNFFVGVLFDAREKDAQTAVRELKKSQRGDGRGKQSTAP